VRVCTLTNSGKASILMQVVVASYGSEIDPAALQTTVHEVAQLISDTDLTVTALSLRLAEKILLHQPAAGPEVAKQVLLVQALRS
jgi:hypothetical protein